MKQIVEDGRIYLPPESKEKPNERVAIHPETNSGQVLMNEKGDKLSDFLGAQVIVSAEKPDRPCLWLRVTATE